MVPTPSAKPQGGNLAQRAFITKAWFTGRPADLSRGTAQADYGRNLAHQYATKWWLVGVACLQRTLRVAFGKRVGGFLRPWIGIHSNEHFASI